MSWLKCSHFMADRKNVYEIGTHDQILLKMY